MEKVKQYFISRNAAFLIDRIHVFTESSKTVELAAQRLNCEPARIAKSLTYVQKKTLSKAENKARQRKGGAAEGAAAAESPNSTNSPNGDLNYVIIVAAGDAKVDNKRYKEKFGVAMKMVKADEVEAAVGYPAGGVCPFGTNDGVSVYLDISLKRFDTVYPACGTDNTGIPVSLEDLETYAKNFVEWVDVCVGWQGGESAAGDKPKESAPPATEDAKAAEQ